MSDPKQNEHLDALLFHVQAASLPWIFPRQSQLGLYYLAQQASDMGFKVQVDNLSSNDHLIRRINRLINQHSCRLAGFYVDQDNMWTIKRILPTLMKLNPSLRVIIGGPQVTSDAEFTLACIPEAICGIIGEGEDTFVKLLSLENFEDLEKCEGLIVNYRGTTKRTPPRKQIEQLDRLSIPERKKLSVDPNTVNPMMITGRGCVGKCAFCYESTQAEHGKRLRLHSVDRSLKEFDYLVREFKNSYIMIVDDAFVTNVERLTEFCSKLISRYNGEVKWFCESRVDILARNPELLPLMIDAGLIRLQVGGESGNQNILDLYGKGTTLQQMRTVVCSAKKNGLLSIYANFIIGGACETHDSYNQTLNFSLELLDLAPGCMEIGSSYYTPYPGTLMYEKPEAYGIKVLDKDVVTGAGDEHVFCRTNDLSRFDILELKQDFKSKVRQKMSELSKTLPRELVSRHFQAFHKWNLATDWYEILTSENQSRYSYFKTIFSDFAKDFEYVAKRNFEDAYPFRTAELVTSKEGRYIVRTLDGSMRQLDPLENMILELSAGKLSFNNIVAILVEQNPDVSLEKLRQACIERLGIFDRECLVVWKTTEQ